MEAELLEWQPIAKEQKQAEKHQCGSQHITSILTHKRLNTESACPLPNDKDASRPQQAVGNNATEGVHQTIDKRGFSSFHIPADERQHHDVGGKGARADRSENPKQQGCEQRNGIGLYQLIDQFFHFLLYSSILYRISLLCHFLDFLYQLLAELRSIGAGILDGKLRKVVHGLLSLCIVLDQDRLRGDSPWIDNLS